jgi:hypothetical protein
LEASGGGDASFPRRYAPDVNEDNANCTHKLHRMLKVDDIFKKLTRRI